MRHLRQPHRLGRIAPVALLLALGVAGIAFALNSAFGIRRSSQGAPTTTPSRSTTATGSAVTDTSGVSGTVGSTAAVSAQKWTEQPLVPLAHAVQDAAAGWIGDRVLVAGGLDINQSSTDRIVEVVGSDARTIGKLPEPMHDAAGAAIDDALYTFGGGHGNNQLDIIIKIDASGSAAIVDHLPTRSSDSGAAVIGGTAYVVGGFTGSDWLDTIVAYTPGSPAVVVAHLPTALRYAAVGAVDGKVWIAGGSTVDAEATTAIYRFDPAGGTVAKTGDLASAVTHAGGIGVGSTMLVAGGRDASSNPLTIVEAIDTSSGAARDAGSLLEARSDLTLVSTNDEVIAIGGRGASGALGSITKLFPTTPVGPPSGADTAAGVYAYAGANELNPVAAAARSLIYVPNSRSGTVDVIDPATFEIVDHFTVGKLPQHITPSWDMKTLYVDNNAGNSLTPIDPTTGKVGGPDIPVDDPYNLYFTLDGAYAIVVAERNKHLDFRDPHTMRLVNQITVPCKGVDHMDFTADGTEAIASCEFSAQMVVVDLASQTVIKTIDLPTAGSMPQDIKLSPDGSTFYVADMASNGLWKIDAASMEQTGFIATDLGAHGLYPSRDARLLYVSNRDAGTISVIDFATEEIVDTWAIPGGSPDMGGVSADGKVLWLSGRYNSEVYAISTEDGRLLARIPVGKEPHGLSVWPQPGRYSLGHTGNTR